MKKRKRRFTNLLSLLLVLSMVFGNVSTAFAAVDTTDGKTAKWTTPGEIAEVNFNFTVKPEDVSQVQVKETDIVLVMDISTSMNDNKKLAEAKNAAKSFIEKVKEKDAEMGNKKAVKIGVVPFRGDVPNSGSNKITALTSDYDKVKSAVNSLKADTANGTNIQAGLHKAEELLKNSTADNKIIVLLCDGEPNRRFRIRYTWDYKSVKLNDDVYWKLYSESNFDYNNIQSSSYMVPATLSEAEIAKSKGYTIYSIGFDISNKTSSNDYQVMYNTASKKDGKVLFSRADVGELENIFDSIYDEIKDTIGAGTGAQVIDTIPEWFEFVEVTSSNKEAVSIQLNEDGTTTLTWDIGNFEKVEKTYNLTYKIRFTGNGLNPEDFKDTGSIKTNDGAALKYKDNEEKTVTMPFADPELDLTSYPYSVTYNIEGGTPEGNTAAVNESGWAFAGTQKSVKRSLAELGLLNPAEKYNPATTFTLNGITQSESANSFTISKSQNNDAVVTVALNEFTVTFYNAEEGSTSPVPQPIPVNGQMSQKVKYGESANEAERPIKNSSEAENFEFLRWSVSNEAIQFVTSNLEIYPVFKSSARVYTVTFMVDVDGDGYYEEQFAVQQVEYGEKPTAPNPAPEKPGDDIYVDYTFSGWSSDQGDWDAEVTGDRIVKGSFNHGEKKTYTVQYYGPEGEYFDLMENNIPYGEKAVKPSFIPVREETSDVTYQFAYWGTTAGYDADSSQSDKYDFDSGITRNITLHAKFEAVAKPTVYFHQDNGTEISKIKVAYNSIVSDIPNEKVSEKVETAEYTYTFNNKWVVMTKTESGVEAGTLIDFANYPITEDLHVKPVYDAVKRSYEVVFYDIENNPIHFIGIDKSEVQMVEYGSYAQIPEKDVDFVSSIQGSAATGAAFYELRFADWDKNPNDPIYGDTNFYSETEKDFAVTFMKQIPDSNNVETVSAIAKFETVFENGDATPPVMNDFETQKYSYKFDGWEAGVSWTGVTQNLIIQPVYTITEKEYTVTFVDYANNTLGTDTVKYGMAATPPSEVPNYNSEDGKTIYVFDNWLDDSYLFVTGNITIQAGYKPIPRVYVTFHKEDGTVISVVDGLIGFDASAMAPPAPVKVAEENDPYTSYNFNGWNVMTETGIGEKADLTNIQYNLDVIATYIGTKLKTYNVRFFDENGKQIGETQVVEYGANAIPENAPVKEDTVKHTYQFDKWITEDGRADAYLNVTSDDDLYPVYKETLREYLVTFWSEGTQVGTPTMYPYGSQVIPEAAPVKQADAQYTYHFTNWLDKEGAAADFNAFTVTENTDFYAAFDQTINRYHVVFADDNELAFKDEIGNEVISTVDYDTLVEADVMAKAVELAELSAAARSDYRNTYSFAGWMFKTENGELVSAAELLGKPVTGDIIVYANYASVGNKYSITYYTYEFGSGSNVVLDKLFVNAGEAHTVAASGPAKADDDYRYTFDSWTAYVMNGSDLYPADLSVLNEITQNIYLYPTYTRVKLHTVTFVDYDGSVIKTEKVVDGQDATAPADPVRPSDDKYNYTFDGWDKEFKKVTEDLTVNAVYTQTEKPAEPTPTPTPDPIIPDPTPTPEPTYPDPTDPEPTNPTEPTEPSEPATEPTVPDETVDIEDEEIPEGAPEVGTTDASDDDDAAVPEENNGDGGSGDEDIEIDDNAIPEGTPTLPQTGTVDSSIFYFFGLLVTAAGVFVLSLKKKRA